MDRFTAHIQTALDLINGEQIVTVVVALTGWFVVHRLTSWRDRINCRRKLQSDFLIKAFQSLANAANRNPATGSPHFRDMEAAVADIQLFGSRSQIDLIEGFTKEFAEKNMASLDPLLKSLRNDLRKELRYEPIGANVRWFRPEGSPHKDIASHQETASLGLDKGEGFQPELLGGTIYTMS